MKISKMILRLWLTICLAALLASDSSHADEEHRLRVLYCGNPGTDRMSDFEVFLGDHFSVTTTHLGKFQPSIADGHDVVIFDWSATYDGQGNPDRKKSDELSDSIPKLTETFDRPAVLVGAAGGKVAMPLKLKLNWYCRCLYDAAYRPRLDHTIFHEPLPVTVNWEERKTPNLYPFLTLDKELGATMNVWKVQVRGYPDVDPGLVSVLDGFEDSPDAEVFAQGISMKGPDNVSIGRHGNFLLWGFSSPPSDLTPAARQLFVNAVHYIRRFDGRKPLVRKITAARIRALYYAAQPQRLTQDYRTCFEEHYRVMFTTRPEWIPEKHNGDTDKYVAELLRRSQQAAKASIKNVFPSELFEQYAFDGEKYTKYYRENLEYLRPVTEDYAVKFIVDEEVKSLGVSNRKVELLDRCIGLLAQAEQSDLARRLLARYTLEKFNDVADWREWLEANRDRLFFTDVGGFKFMAAPSE